MLAVGWRVCFVECLGWFGLVDGCSRVIVLRIWWLGGMFSDAVRCAVFWNMLNYSVLRLVFCVVSSRIIIVMVLFMD